ncbi:group 1 truncated hemoglobin [Ammoniphilus sp. YIM 78166]|uniref:group I truncated hemoglobin n=1 Tax=Ammoniphilus sp. YIM 78166 TaxID=1644106 RepID=UPI00106FB323|nr:group 1 truncated hemoglobin [Ammoniphilus sp. YIM 78166]
MEQEKSLYEILGGEEAIGAVVDRFYEKVLADETISHFFAHTDMEKQRRHQTLFISWATGGPNQYSGKSMERAHEGMNLQEAHFGAVAHHLVESLKEFQVDDRYIDQVVNKLLTLKDAVLGK